MQTAKLQSGVVVPGPAWVESASGWLLAWHLLSLDAPTVAVVWAWFLARSVGVVPPLWPLLLLPLATWIYYVADRVLDSYAAAPLQPRHRFHRRHQTALLAGAVPAMVVLFWGVWRHLPAAELRAYFWLGLAALVYLGLVHGLAQRRRLPNEVFVGVVFALAAAVPAWAALPAHSPRLYLLAAEVALFAAACWLNCVAIAVWEQIALPWSHWTTRLAGVHFSKLALTLALLAAVLLPPRLAIAVFASGALLWLLHRRRGQASPLFLRIAADLALLTPLLLVRW